MSKAVLVMDMPISCEQCRLHRFVGKDCDVICAVQGKTQSYEEAYKSRPDWCPLRELPNPKEKGNAENILEIFSNAGYNACIDELLKEE